MRQEGAGQHTNNYQREGLFHGLGPEGRKWEEDRAIGTSFGYNRNESLADYQTSGSLICLLVNLVSQGGNLCLDVGPTADGRIPMIA